jgi:hypothetical protein
MGLTATLRRKADTWYWRARYWWFDTEGGAWARSSAVVLSALVVIAQTVRLAMGARAPERVDHPQHAVIWFVVYLIVALIAAAVAYAMTPKAPGQKVQEANPPSTEDGQAVVDILGTGWIEDYFVLAWKPNGVEKIKAKGKK